MLQEISQGQLSRLEFIVNSQTKISTNNNGTKSVFLAAGGYFQEEYIALFEQLTNTSPSEESSTENEYDNARFIADVFYERLKAIYKNKLFNFNKIFSVTIPSQIIAKFLFEKIEKEFYTDKEIQFFTNIDGQEAYERKLPLLIRLSSYYSFDEEINFQNIKAGDRVLIINDVISTGNLITNIINSISTKVVAENRPTLKAKVEKILAFVDTRISEDEINKLVLDNPMLKSENICRSSYFYSNSFLSENDIISLTKKLVLKFKNKPLHLQNAKLIRINPILNAPVTFPTRHSEEDKIAFRNPREFLERLPSKDLKIGHFHQNSLHHPYFIKPNDLFKKDEETGLTNDIGIKLFQSVISRVYNLEHSVNVAYYLESLTLQLTSLKSYSHLFNLENEGTAKQFENAHLEIQKLSQFTSIDKHYNLNQIANKLKVDYVFRPVFSGVELLSRIDITQFCEVEISNIVELHRFDTIKGWRFIIPPKYLNDSLINKTALIIDMGSFTGDSIIQMVDALSVYQLSKIIVVSLIGRIEDFDREFLSRLREIKVKRRKTDSDLNKNLPENSVANISIYFGTTLHIPPYPSIKVCKFCKEREKIESYLEAKECTSTYVRRNIEERKRDIELLHVNEIKSQCPTYFPEFKAQCDEKYDTLVFYKIRDDLGKIDGYRFYEDYYDYFDKLVDGSINYRQDMEAIIAVCLHESHLLITIKNQLPDIFNNLKEFIKGVIINDNIDSLFYKWQKKELLRFHLAINEKELLNDGFISIINFTDNDERSKNLLLFFIWEKHFEYRKEINKQFSVYEFRDNMFDVRNKIGNKYEDILDEIYTICIEFDYIAFSEIDLSFYKLKLFFKTEASYNSRPSNLSSGLTTHPSIYNAVNRLKTPLNRCENDPSNFILNIDEFRQNWSQKKERLQNELIKPLEKVKEFIKSSDTTGAYEFMYLSGSSKNINFLIASIDSCLSEIKQDNLHQKIHSMRQSIDTIMQTYLSIRSTFAIFCAEFLNFNPVTVLKSYFASNDFTDLRILDEHLMINLKKEKQINDYMTNIHPLILQCVYKEIFNNYNQYSDGSIFTVEDKIHENTFIITFTQNSRVKDPQKPKPNNNNKVCFLNLENNLLSPFGITFYSNKADFYNPKILNQPDSFIQEIKIPIFKSFKHESI